MLHATSGLDLGLQSPNFRLHPLPCSEEGPLALYSHPQPSILSRDAHEPEKRQETAVRSLGRGPTQEGLGLSEV